jgi:hypothetical protein
VGQGGTASPAFWLIVSSTLFDCHRNHTHGMSLMYPTSQLSSRQWLKALLDNSLILTNIELTQYITELTQTLKLDTKYWKNLLSMLGGCLELPKCFYYVLAWTFRTEGDLIPVTMNEL